MEIPQETLLGCLLPTIVDKWNFLLQSRNGDFRNRMLLQCTSFLHFLPGKETKSNSSFFALMIYLFYYLQTCLAFLDFMLCFLFICCFGAPAAATHLRIKLLYLLVKDYSPEFLIISRIVQLSIPYVLILNTADRLRWIDGSGSSDNQRGFKVVTLLCIVGVVIALRLPGYFAVYVYDIPDCDLFASKVLAGVDMSENVQDLFRWFDIVVQFLHLFVSFIVLFVLNFFVIQKLRSSHKRARRQSSCPQAMNTIRTLIEQEEKREGRRLRYAIKTTIVLISSYLICNSVNFILFSIEMWNTQVLKEEGSFSVWYVAFSDLGTNLFVLSSAIRMFIFYKYNPEIRAQLKSVLDLDSIAFSQCCKKREDKKVEILLGVPL